MNVRSLLVVGLLSFAFTGCGPQEQEGPLEEEIGSNAQMLIGAPTRLITVPNKGYTDLSWPAVSGAVSYRVYSGSISGVYSWSWPSNTTSSTDPNAPGAPRFYVVRAIDAAGNYSAASPEATATAFANLALGRPANQSSFWDPNRPAGAAVDGNVDGYWANGSVASTNWACNGCLQWWRVDLGESSSVYSVDVWSSTEPNCVNHLHNVFTSNESTTDPASWTKRNDQALASGRPTSLDLAGITGRHLKVEQNTPDLAVVLAEVQVWGTTKDTQSPSTPTGFTGAEADGPRIDLSWNNSNDNVGVKGYEIDRCIGVSCNTNWTDVDFTSNLNTTDYWVTAHTTYRYRLRAKDFANKGSSWTYINVSVL